MNLIHSAIEHLSKKKYSEKELHEVLQHQYKALPDLDKALNETMTYLKHHGLIHDVRLANDIAYHYAHKGNQFIRNTLILRKINTDVINSVLISIPDEYLRAWEEAQKRLNSTLMHIKSSREQICTIALFLSGRHFCHATITRVMNQLHSKTTRPAPPLNNLSWSLAS